MIIDNESIEIIRAFVNESLDVLDKHERTIHTLETVPSKESISAVFRGIHTIKGLAGFLNFHTIHSVTHEAEMLLDALRIYPNAVGKETVLLMRETFDVLRVLLNTVASTMRDTGSEEMAQHLITHLRRRIRTIQQEYPKKQEHLQLQAARSASASRIENLHDASTIESHDKVAMPVPRMTPYEQPQVLDSKSDTEKSNREKIQGSMSHNQFTRRYDASSDVVKRYVTEALELVSIAEQACLSLERQPSDMEAARAIFAAVHSLKGNSGFMGFTDIEEISTDIENILDALREKKLEVYPGLISMLLTNLDTIRIRIDKIAQECDAHMYSHIIPESLHTVEHNSSAPNNRVVDDRVQSTIVEHEQSSSTEHSVSSLLASQEHSSQKTSQHLSEVSSMQRRDIRVDTEKLDKLFDLVGELITIEAMVIHNPDAQMLQSESFTKALRMLSKVTRELQEVTMSIRMMPLEGLFNKMKRLVRDLSQRLDKKVHLEIKGAETEMDKTIIEEIADPLMHILRNAIDHGIETPEHRIQVGKSEIGTITLQACYEGNEILLIVEDDGAGINRTTVLEVAQKKGILKTNPDKISDAEVYALIFEPGFSTAEHVTDISGRGVGMDVVKRNIEKLQGSITVQSHEGRGTRFVLHIPLTLAIMDAMIVRVGSNTYALPMLSIRESFRPEQRAITVTMDGQELVRVRNDIYAVIRLHEVYQCTPSTLQLHEGIIIVVEYRERKACLFVDEIVGQQQIVVRSLSQYVGNVRGITGCMIQSNGEVGLIIDVETLLQIGVPTANAALATS